MNLDEPTSGETGSVLRRALVGGLVGTAGATLALFALMNDPADSAVAGVLLYGGRVFTVLVGATVGAAGLRLAFKDFF